MNKLFFKNGLDTQNGTTQLTNEQVKMRWSYLYEIRGRGNKKISIRRNVILHFPNSDGEISISQIITASHHQEQTVLQYVGCTFFPDLPLQLPYILFELQQLIWQWCHRLHIFLSILINTLYTTKVQPYICRRLWFSYLSLYKNQS